MSAGRFEWEATRYEHVDPVSRARLVVTQAADATWSWNLRGISSGTAASSSAAKGAARKALAAHLAQAVRS